MTATPATPQIASVRPAEKTPSHCDPKVSAASFPTMMLPTILARLLMMTMAAIGWVRSSRSLLKVLAP